jgi:hypothetical protein
VIAVLTLPLSAPAQEIRLGSEFQVNSYTTSAQNYPAVAADGDGDFVVTWLSYGQDGSSFGVFGRRFTSAGVPLGGEFHVNSFTSGLQYKPAVAMDADGDFVVAWLSKDQDGSDDGVFAQRYSSSGSPLASEFQVHSYTMYEQSHPSVALDADGDFVVAWQSFRYGPSVDIFVRRFSSTGAALSGDLQVNTFTPSLQNSPSVAADADGDFVVVWSSDLQDGADEGIFARRFSSAGTPLGGELQVNVATEGDQNAPMVDADADGDFVVAWRNDDLALTIDVFARRFSSAGVAQTGEFQVNQYTTGGQYFASVATGTDGDFVVTWSGANGQDGSDYGVFARGFSSAGIPVAAEFQVNTYTAAVQRLSSVAADAEGDFVIAWHSQLDQDGSSGGIFAQRFGVATAIATATATATVTPTRTPTPTSTSTPTATTGALYEIPTLSRGAMAILTLLLLTACLTLLLRA